MAPPNNPQVARVNLITSRDGRQGINTFHITKDPPSPLTLTDLQNVATVFGQWWSGSYKALVTNTVGLDQIQVRKYDPSNPLMWDQAVAHETGTSAGPTEPASVTAAVSLRTGLAGRSQRGRFYALGMPTSVVTATDLITSAGAVAYALSGANLIGRLFTAFFNPVIFHRDTNTWTEIFTCVMESIIDNQRRRLPGRGR